jgi:very-short-patch-repair endonuclease
MRAGLRSKTEGRKLPAMNFTPRKTTRRARGLRSAQTESEKRLWGYLRDRRLNGHKFVRQEPVGPFFADFLCRERKLIVEVDGATHSEVHEVAYDARRTVFLEGKGFRVLRVQSADVFQNLNDVLDMILLALEDRLG